MTANFRTAADYASPAPVLRPRASDHRGVLPDWPDRIAFPLLIGLLLLIYGLLQNPYWVPAGDSELYASAARSLAMGHGYTFLGQPVAISPPGWSWMMSLVMRITGYILPLKLLAMSCMIASLAMGYWVARRFVSPMQAVGVILLTAIISHVYQATYWLISEGSFCLATTATILLAMQIAEGRRQWWRIVLLLLACFAAVSIRWAGVLGLVIVVGALLDGQLKPRLTLPWVTSILVILVSAGSFVGWRHGLLGTPEQQAAAADAITGSSEDTGAAPDTGPPIVGTASQNAKVYQLFPPGSPIDRFLNWGRWFSYLYWQPFRAAGSNVWILRAATLSGWAIILVLSVTVFQSVRRKKWIWLATGMYTGALAMGWPNVNARYYVPVAFLITLGIFLANDELMALLNRHPGWRKVVFALFLCFVATTAVCNAALYSVEMVIARSDRFYERYEDGMDMPLIQACEYLDAQPDRPSDTEIAVSPRYSNLNRTRASPFGIRATVWLTGRDDILSPRWKDTTVPPNSSTSAGRNLRRWLKAKDVRWYLYQPDVNPWRVWHFRLGWYQKMQTGEEPARVSSGWILYRLGVRNGEDDWIPVRLPNRFEPVTRVPGLGKKK
jgi:hypothetical protein